MQFDQDTRLRALSPGRYRGTVSSAWNIGENPNGGYLVSLVLAAVKDSVSHPDPVSITTHFLRPGVAGEAADIDVQIVRTGRLLTTVRATLTQQDKARVEVIAAFTDLEESPGVDAPLTRSAPALAPPERCIERTGALQQIDLPITASLNVLLDPVLAQPGQSGKAEMAGWIGFADGRAPDTHCLALFADAFPPSPLSYLGPVGWVPTIELTVHVLARPAPGLVQAHFVTDSLSHGRMVESGCLWDATGQLVAQSRQLGLVLTQK